MSEIRMGRGNLSVAAKLRSRIEQVFKGKWRYDFTFESRFDVMTTYAKQLQQGFKVYLKYGDGRNVGSMLSSGELLRLGITEENAFVLIQAVAKYCVDQERTAGQFPAKLEGLSIYLEELRQLTPQDRMIVDQKTLLVSLDRLFRYKSALKNLRQIRSQSLYLGETPFIAVRSDKVALMMAVIKAGYDIEEFELAVDMWKSGEITLEAPEGIVQLSALMEAFYAAFI